MTLVKNLSIGSIIKLRGTDFIVLNPVTGLVRSQSGFTSFFNANVDSNLFNPASSANIGYQLNNEYYNQFSATEKAIIQDKDWGTGALNSQEAGLNGSTPSLTISQMTALEQTSKVRAKVGMLSASEWLQYKNRLVYPNTGFAWTITPYETRGGAFVIAINGNDPRNLINTQTISTSVTVYPALYLDPNANFVNGVLVTNSAPTITLNTANNKTLYENDSLTIGGTVTDADSGNSVTVKYQINNGDIRAIKAEISAGAAIPFSRQLTFKGGQFFDGALPVTTVLAAGSAHTLKVWAEDDQNPKGVSAEQLRTFYVIPNRAPALTVDPFTPKNGLIEMDAITISGSTSDPDGNAVTVNYKVNNGTATQIENGPAGPWSFNLSLSDLPDGENKIIVEVIDSYGFKSSKTITLNKAPNQTPLAQSVQRYKLTPPNGSAQGVLLWIQRAEETTVSAEISMTNGSEQEAFVPMVLTPDSTTEVDEGIVEDEFTYEAAAAKDNIVVELTFSGGPITLVSGVLD